MSNISQACMIIIPVISLVSSIISTAIPYWTYGSDGEITAYDGLWKLCIISEQLSSVQCVYIRGDEVGGWFIRVRALMVIGVILLAMGTGLSIYSLTKKVSTPYPGLIVTGGGVCCLTAAIIYCVNFNKLVSDLPVYLHTGFGLSIVAGLLGVMGGVWPLLYSARVYYEKVCLIITSFRNKYKIG